MKITIAHLYPDLLNLYGDTGNITALLYRMKKRGIEVDIKEISAGEKPDFESVDIVFVGGGSDKKNKIVCENMKSYADKLKAYVENGGTVLAVCGGFQIMGKSYKLGDETIDALGIVDITADCSAERLIGDVVLKSDILNTEIVGFENHSGLMDIGTYTPLGKVVAGYGNDGKSGYEGIVYKNLIGTYLHGPLLPKNPILADYIISGAIKKRYGSCELEKLDDTLEIEAHDYIVKRFGFAQ